MNRNNLQFLRIRVPQGSGFSARPEGQFESFLATISRALPEVSLSFEMVTMAQYTSFVIAVDKSRGMLVESLVYAQFQEAEIEFVEDYLENKDLSGLFSANIELVLKKNDIYPIKRFDGFEADSLSGLFAMLGKLKKDQFSVLQVIATPLKDRPSLRFRNRLKMRLNSLKQSFSWKRLFKKDFSNKGAELIRIKLGGNLFQVGLRLSCFAPNQDDAALVAENLAKCFVHFKESGGNSIISTNVKLCHGVPKLALTRENVATFQLSSTELATIFHFPNPDSIPHISHVLSRKGEPPQGLPNADDDSVSHFGITNFHNQFEKFGINRVDRRRHLYVIGKSGVGKSKLLELLIQQDILAGKGVAVLDPHGDLVDNVLRFIPKERIKDVIYFDPADVSFPIAFNPLENVSPEYKMRVTIGFIDIFKKLFGLSWTSRLEHVLRYTTLALLDTPGTTVFSILKLLTDKNYRQHIVAGIQDGVVKNFWVHEFASWSEKFDNEAITPLLNKVGQFVSTGMIRNIVGQPENTFDVRKVMDEQKILLMKVSKGLLGEENAGLIGSMLITKIQQAAMSRANILEDDRKDFYFYVDEFHNFATDTFAEILSEARKYRLNLTIAHQYMGQLTETVRKTVFGNVGNMISFRVGAEDAEVLAKEYSPTFQVRDIINLGVQEFYLKMSINGELSKAFSGRTINLVTPKEDFTKEIIDRSRSVYARPLQEVEKMVNRREEGGYSQGKSSDGLRLNSGVEVMNVGDPVFEVPLL